jgi:hypothetical protein
MIAVIHTGSVNLTKWVAYVPYSGKFAQSIQRRIQRWLYNPRINIHRLYKPLIQAALEAVCKVLLKTTQSPQKIREYFES